VRAQELLMQRRDALRLLSTLALASSFSARAAERKIKSIGLQLYTVRAALEADFDTTLARVAAIGYREVEFAGYFGRSAQEVRDKLCAAPVSSHRPRTFRSKRLATAGRA
jgi:hypothetical protein